MTLTNRRSAMKFALAVLSFTAVLAAAPDPVQAQPAFPGKPVRILTPFPPGSGPDAALRLVAEALGRKWGQAVVVENKAGGNGFIAISTFKQAAAAADGYQLIQLDNNHVTTHPHTFSKLPFDAEKDFTPLSMILRTSFFVAVAADSPYKTLDDIIAAARAQPGKINYGSWFVGSPGHMGALKLESIANVKMTHVPFRDFGQLYAAVANKEVDWALGSVASAGGLERAGKLRFIALAAAKRDPLYPDVPSTAENAATRGFEIKGWTGLYGPRGLPDALRDQIAASIAEALATPEVAERYRTLGFETPTYSPTELGALIRRESSEWAVVIKAANLKLD
jgi:tripartite-type tricarboxylate transporter receptor subunit TctC